MTTFGLDADVRRMVAAWEAGLGVLLTGSQIIPAGRLTAAALTFPFGARWDDGGWCSWTI
jgi:hypothetical protein